MSRETVSEDAEFARLLRSVMAEESESAPVAPDWEPLRSRLWKVRRRRRLHSAARVGAGLLAVIAVIALVNGRVGFAPGNQATSPARPPLVGEPVRGSLRSDQAWLTALRRHVADSPDIRVAPSSHNFGGPLIGPWQPPSAANVQVIFAGEVAGYRLALVAGTWTPTPKAKTGPRKLDLQRWYVGPTGAAVEDLQPGSLAIDAKGSAQIPVQTIQPASMPKSTASMKRTGVAVAIVADTADVRLAGPAAYTADGRASLRLPNRSLPATEPGVYAVPIPADGAYRLVVDGVSPTPAVALDVVPQIDPTDRASRPEIDAGLPEYMRDGGQVSGEAIDFSRQVLGVEPPLPDVLKPQRGGPTPPRDVLRYAFGRAALYSGLKTSDSTYTLLSARPGLDTKGRVNEWTVAVAVTAPSGAGFVAVCEVLKGGHALYDPYLDAWKLVPSGSLDSLALVWPISGIDQDTVTPMGLVDFFGPPAAVSAEVLGAQGQVIETIPVSGQIAVSNLHQATKSVRFRDASGKVLAQAPVMAYVGGAVNPPAMSWPTSAG